MKKKIAIFGIGLASVCSVMIGGYALAASGTDSAPTGIAADDAATMKEIVKNASPDQLKAQVDAAPAEQRVGLQAQIDQVKANKVRVDGKKGFVGYVTADALTTKIPTSTKDLFPVVDDSGAVVAYWGGGGVGVIDKALVDSGAPIDFVAIRNHH